jgi:hypothetical protein
MKRIKEAVSEIRKTARKDPIVAGEGAVLFLEKVSQAIEHVDSSSGAIGTAVNNAIATLVPVIVHSPVEDKLRDEWMDRLWYAVEADNIPYLELLPDHWGELCVTPERSSYWADELINSVRMAWSPDPLLRGYFKGTVACLSALLKAGRNTEIIELLEHAPYQTWHYRMWGVKALQNMGKSSEAILFAEESRGLNEPDFSISEACEEILLSSDMVEEAYNLYAIQANWKTTYLATFRAITKKYPNKPPAEILKDLVDASPGTEGKWFAAAKSVGLYDEAIELANRTPCDPKTLSRAARDLSNIEPKFAVEAGLAALRWLVAGYGYDITSFDVRTTFDHTIKAAEIAECRSEVCERIYKLVAEKNTNESFVCSILRHKLGFR